MSRMAGSARRLLALWLVTAFVGGPLGLGGVLHSFDDDPCEPVRGPVAALLQAGAGGVAADPPDHCPTCHLLRSARWIGSLWPALLHAPLPGCSTLGTGMAAPDDRLVAARPARSPPPSLASRFL
jgi:hypothetical protein